MVMLNIRAVEQAIHFPASHQRFPSQISGTTFVGTEDVYLEWCGEAGHQYFIDCVCSRRELLG